MKTEKLFVVFRLWHLMACWKAESEINAMVSDGMSEAQLIRSEIQVKYWQNDPHNI